MWGDKNQHFQKIFLLGQVHDLEVAVVGVGTDWIHGFTKKKIYTVTKPSGVVRYIILHLQGLGFKAHAPSAPPGHTPGKKCIARGIIVKSTAGHK